MEDLESFKEARLKMDPTARRLSSGQWQQAYEAHLRAKERVHGGRRERSDGASASKEARGHSGLRPRRGASGRVGGGLGPLRRQVREQTGYADLRLIVDLLAWVAIALVVLKALVPLFFNSPIPVSLLALLNALIGVIAVIAGRLLVHMLIDIPDIALYRLEHRAEPDFGNAGEASEATREAK